MVAQVLPFSTVGTADANDRCFWASQPYRPLPSFAVEQPPVRVFLSGELAGWRLLQSLQVEIVRDDDGYFNAGDNVFNVYGDGPTPEAALRCYREALLEYYEIVAEGAQNNPHDCILLQRLQQYLSPTQ